MQFGLVALWLAVFLLLGLVALPVSTWLFRDLDAPALAIPLALAVLGVVGFLVGHVAFGWPAALAGLLTLVGVSGLAVSRVDPDWDGFWEPAVVFVIGFLVVVALRAVDPVAAPLPIATGEKFLDFGLLKTLERSSTLPPEDMWYAGKPVQYHYGGHVLTSLLSTLTGTEPRFAYNLGLAGFYGALVTAAWGLASSIASPCAVSRRLAAGLAAFFVGIAGNLSTTVRLVTWLLPDGFVRPLAETLGFDSGVTEWAPRQFHYFDASRVLPVFPNDPDSYLAATEFPLFAWVNGDLHAHMLVQVFVLLVAAILLAYWRTPPSNRRRRWLLLLGVVPPVAGFVSVTNIWSFPTMGGLVFLTVLFAPGNPASLLPDRLRAVDWLAPRGSPAVEEVRRLGFAVVAAPIVLALAIVWVLPFWLGPVANGPARSLELWSQWSPLGPLLVVHGAFLAAFVPYLGRRLGVVTDNPALVWGAGLALAVAGLLVGFPALGLMGTIGLAAWWLLRARDDVGFELLLVLAGAGLVLMVELVTIPGERFNVIFKPYADAWLFWGVATGVILARLVAGWPADLLERDRPRWHQTGALLAILLVVSTGTYAFLLVPSHFERGTPAVEAEGPTLDATAYVEHAFPGEAPAIRWLDARQGQPHIVTAAPGGYWWVPEEGKGASAPASLTGLPTVLGWFHEKQYRGAEAYEQRLSDVRTIYTGQVRRGGGAVEGAGGPAAQAALLREYDVEYVYVGPAERATYGEITIEQVDGVSVAKQWDVVTIYAVDQSALD